MSALLSQPSHLLSLTVQPLHCKITSNLAQGEGGVVSLPHSAAVRATREGRDPYCVFRERYCRGRPKTSPRPVRQKCNFAEMNRLLSQLAEVGTYLQRTRQECELIEERCREKAPVASAGKRTGSGGKGRARSNGKEIEHSISSSSYGSDSGKGSIEEDPEPQHEEVAEERGGEEVDRGLPEETESREAGDREVERLLCIAQRLTRQVRDQQQKKGTSQSNDTYSVG